MHHRYKLIFVGVSCLIVWKFLVTSSPRQPASPAIIDNEFHVQQNQSLSFSPSGKESLATDKTPVKHHSQSSKKEQSPGTSGAASSSSASSSAKETVAFAVFYETLCPDSRGFFINQLLPSLERAPDIFTVTLVPYGKAITRKETKGLEFHCQHGPLECQGNTVHACATKYVKDQLTLVRYTTCMISDNIDPEDAGKRCARSLAINWDPIAACAKAEEGKLLLAQMGEATHKLYPPVSFIPTIEVNKNLGYQASLLKRLFEELCTRFKVKPPPCVGISTVAFHAL